MQATDDPLLVISIMASLFYLFFSLTLYLSENIETFSGEYVPTPSYFERLRPSNFFPFTWPFKISRYVPKIYYTNLENLLLHEPFSREQLMKYRRLFAFLMQSTMWLFHFKSLDIVTPSIFAQSVTGSSFLSTSRGEKLWEIFLKAITISLHLSAFSCIRLDRDQSSTAVTACYTLPREREVWFGKLSYRPHTSTWERQPWDHWSWVRKARAWWTWDCQLLRRSTCCGAIYALD